MTEKILLCISGGGAIQLESAAGVLAALDESGALAGAEIEYRACSGGAPAAALHAAGMSGGAIAELIRRTPMNRLLRWPLLSRYCDVENLYKLLETHLPDNPLRNCRIAVTRLRDMRSMLVDATPVTVLASMSIPGIFRAQLIGGEEFTDGGVMNLVPTPPIPAIPHYAHIYILLSPRSRKESSSSIWLRPLETELKSLIAVMDREITQIRENQWDALPNVTVIQPDIPEKAEERSLFDELLNWSPGNCMVEHARQFTLAQLREAIK